MPLEARGPARKAPKTAPDALTSLFSPQRPPVFEPRFVRARPEARVACSASMTDERAGEPRLTKRARALAAGPKRRPAKKKGQISSRGGAPGSPESPETQKWRGRQRNRTGETRGRGRRRGLDQPAPCRPAEPGLGVTKGTK